MFGGALSVQFSKGFACIMHIPYMSIYWRKVPVRRVSMSVPHSAEAKDTSEALKKACLEAPVLAFADFDKPFLLESMMLVR